MDEKSLRLSLRDLSLGELRYFESLGSTNDEALAWAALGARDLSLVVADEQTSGRGREGRKWFTPPDAALAFSLLLRPSQEETPHVSRLVGLAALSVADALRSYGLAIEVKWPNDVLIGGRKVAGILVESVWSGEDVDCAVIGIGLNVLEAAVPPQEMLNFPATSLQETMGDTLPPRKLILHDILRALIERRLQLGSDELISEWEQSLAFRGENVQVSQQNEETLSGSLSGLATDGSLLLQAENGKLVTVRFGDVRLRRAE